MSGVYSRNSSTGTVKLAQDLAKLVNNPQGSDVQFKIGGGSINPNIQSTGETIIDPSGVLTMYAHSAILRCRSRYFAAIFENEKEWRERSGGVIHIPNMLSYVFQKILDYIYTGEAHLKAENLPELIAAAEEMELKEFGIECQATVMHVLEEAFSSEEDNNDDDTSGYFGEVHYSKQRLPIDVAVREVLIPVLKLAHDLKLLDFFQQIFGFTINHIEIILSSPDTRTVFLNKIPTHIFSQILASDILSMQEFDVWELALNVACYKTMISKSAVETHFKLEGNVDYEIEQEIESTATNDNTNSEERGLLSDEQLKQLKLNLIPLLPAVRFSLIEGDRYSSIVDILSHFLPTRRFLELHRFYAQADKTRQLDSPRRKNNEPIKIPKSLPIIETPSVIEASSTTKVPDEDLEIFSKIIDKVDLWKQIKKWIVESKLTMGSHSRDVTFKLLFRASEHGFSATTFHEHCDDKAQTLVVVKSDDGYIFGGVNFALWKPSNSYARSYAGTTSNFLFTLADGHHCKSSRKFSCIGNDGLNTYNCYSYGPAFGSSIGLDFYIENSSHTNHSYSYMPSAYNGLGASTTILAGKSEFLTAEYEVFSILRKE